MYIVMSASLVRPGVSLQSTAPRCVSSREVKNGSPYAAAWPGESLTNTGGVVREVRRRLVGREQLWPDRVDVSSAATHALEMTGCL